MKLLESGAVWGVLVLDAAGVQIVSGFFWGLLLLIAGALVLLRALGADAAVESSFGGSVSTWTLSSYNRMSTPPRG